MKSKKILIVDDEQAIRLTLSMILEHAGYEVAEAVDGYQAIDAVTNNPPDLVLLDIKMPGMDGLEVLRKINDLQNKPEIIVLSGHASISAAVEATRLGAYDFHEKPFQKDRILLSISNAFQARSLLSEVEEYRSIKQRRYQMVGTSAAIQRVRDQMAKVAATNASVLITGESGTGKELVAREIHYLSQREDQAFVHVNCAAIPETLIENELFGHERGAYTGAGTRMSGKFEQADRGTIFLDEVGDMSLPTQAKVLRVLQDGEYQRVGGNQILHANVRVVSATNKDLIKLTEAGTFREDLYFRLNVVPIKVPALRERVEDIPLLINHFATEFAAENGIRPPTFHESAVAALLQYSWPGNIRELKNAVERLLIMVRSDIIREQDLDLGPRTSALSASAVPWTAAETLQEFQDQSERWFIIEKLKANKWNIKATAEAINTPRSNLYKKLKQYGIDSKE